MSDRLFGAVAVVGGLLFIWGALQIQTGLLVDPLGPQTFPVIIGATLAIAGLYPLFRPDPEPQWPGVARAVEILVAVAVLVAYALILDVAGFVLATALAAAALSWRLGARPLAAGLTGIGISAGIYTVFHLILGLSLARGPWGF